MSLLDEKSVKNVRDALTKAEHPDTIIETDEPITSITKAAAAIGVEPGAVIQTLVYKIGKKFVMVLVAGDHKCKEDALPRAFNLEGDVIISSDAEARSVTGFPEDGISPLGLPYKVPMVIDVSLKRFETLYANAGHGQCFFSITVTALKRFTGGIISYNIAEPA